MQESYSIALVQRGEDARFAGIAIRSGYVLVKSQKKSQRYWAIKCGVAQNVRAKIYALSLNTSKRTANHEVGFFLCGFYDRLEQWL